MISGANLAAKFTVAGTWDPLNNPNAGLANTDFANIPLGPNGLQGLVASGWSYHPGTNTLIPVDIAFLEQQSDGTLSVKTSGFVSSPRILGANSIVTQDINSDGKPDVILVSYSEDPFSPAPTTVLLSNTAGTFDKITLNDSVVAYNAVGVMLNGQFTVLTRSFPQGDPMPTYTFDLAGSATEHLMPGLGATNGYSIEAADFDGDGSSDIAIGQFISGPGVPFNPNAKPQVAIYRTQGGDITGSPVALVPQYFTARPKYSDPSLVGAGVSAAYRMLVDDFNHDNRPDLVVMTYGPYLYNMPQMLQNGGSFQFTDVTDILNPDYNVNNGSLDYTPLLLDIDHSGINSLLLSDDNDATTRNVPQANYLLVNDGTGRLHVALHDQFTQIGQQVLQYLKEQTQAGKLPGVFIADNWIPSYRGYLTGDGKLNFVAELPTPSIPPQGGQSHPLKVFVNVPMQYNVTTDYTDAITISDRNGSHLIRTFAGNDIINGGNSGGFAHVDGGLGRDVAVYSGHRSDYVVTRTGATEWTVADQRSGSPDGIDTLVNIESLQFADRSVGTVGVHDDFDGNGTSDILWRHASGTAATWLLNNAQVQSSIGDGGAPTNWNIIDTGDFNGDGTSDLLWRDSNSGTVAIWQMSNGQVQSSIGVGAVASNWHIVATADFNGDGKSDLLWRDANSGTLAVWEMNGGAVTASIGAGGVASAWQVVGAGDFNGDGKSDILFRNTSSGTVAIWEMNGGQVQSSVGLGDVGLNWNIAGIGDFNGDGTSDLLWRDSNSGTIAVWEMQNGQVTASLGVGSVGSNWQINGTGDYNGDGKADILFRDSNTGTVAVWEMNGGSVIASVGLGAADSSWSIVHRDPVAAMTI